MKKAYGIYRQKGYRLRLLSAAFRNHLHWSQFIGGDVVISPPCEWQKRFNASDIEVKDRMSTPVDAKIVETLYGKFAEFRKAYDVDGLPREQFDSYGATRRTLRAFCKALDDLVAQMRDIMLPKPGFIVILPGSPILTDADVCKAAARARQDTTEVKGMRENERVAAHILVIDDEVEMGTTLKQLLVDNGFEVSVAVSAKEGLRILQSRSIDLTICDIVMADMSGLLFIEKAGDCGPIIMMTAFASIETARKAFKLGARDYLVKPFDIDELLVVINQNLKRCLPGRASGDHRWMQKSRSPEFNKMMQLARQFSATDMPMLITGESGVGKELFAEYIHEGSRRAKKPFIRMNCAAIPDALLESELFGYEKGAFTGAASARAGKFAEADGGTMFLDEIGDMQSIALRSRRRPSS